MSVSVVQKIAAIEAEFARTQKNSESQLHAIYTYCLTQNALRCYILGLFFKAVLASVSGG